MIEKIKESLAEMPQLLTSKDLVTLGLYKNRPEVHVARFRGEAPACMRIDRTLVFSRSAVIEFVQDRMKAKKCVRKRSKKEKSLKPETLNEEKAQNFCTLDDFIRSNECLFTPGQMRSISRRRKENGANYALAKIGKSIFVDKERFRQWVRRHFKEKKNG